MTKLGSRKPKPPQKTVSKVGQNILKQWYTKANNCSISYGAQLGNS